MKRALLAALLVASCRPDFGDRDSLVTKTQVIAVRGEPPDGKPGTNATYTVLVVSPDGPVNAPASYAFCASPKLLTENDSVASACLRDAVRPVAATAATPGDACYLFGPETPPGGYRPRDPDATGGYFQPIRVDVAGVRAFGFERVLCNLANAPALAASDFSDHYVLNVNPTPALIAPARIARGARATLRVEWAATDAESYVTFDPATQTVVTRREAMRVSWFSTAGAFDEDRTGRTESEPDAFTENGWSAPSAPTPTGAVHVWTVLRDSRGGVGWSDASINVE